MNENVAMIEFGQDYFCDDVVLLITFWANVKGCAHRMFLHIMNIIVAPNSYFQHKCDVYGVLGLSSIFKHTLAIKDIDLWYSCWCVRWILQVGRSDHNGGIEEILQNSEEIF